MAYVEKLLGEDEKLIGVGRLHWIYVLKGIAWFCALAGAGWMLNAILARVLLTVSGKVGLGTLPSLFMTFGNIVTYFLMGAGFLVFLASVVNVLVTEVGLSTRRILYKRGWLFVKVDQIDLEEIKGENLDTGYFGRLLNYGYIKFDSRFIGDITLPALEGASGFLRALHDARGNAQDTMSVMLRKGKPLPMAIVNADEVSGHAAPKEPQQQTPEQLMQARPQQEQAQQQQPEIPQPSPPSQPEIQPGQPGPSPEVQPGSPDREINPPAPIHNPDPAPQPEQPQTAPAPPEQPKPNPGQPTQPPLDANAIEQVMEKMLPKVTEQVMHDLAEKGLLKDGNENTEDKDVDNDLIHRFDEAAFDKDGRPRDLRHKVEHAIH
jgi:hypothetical protein